MKSLERRIQRLEAKLLPATETEADRVLNQRIIEGRRRVAEAFGETVPADVRGEDSAADVPQPPYATAGRPRRSKRSELDRLVDLMHRGRERARLRYLQTGDRAASSGEKVSTQGDSQ
jgi:hypothetical protein